MVESSYPIPTNDHSFWMLVRNVQQEMYRRICATPAAQTEIYGQAATLRSSCIWGTTALETNRLNVSAEDLPQMRLLGFINAVVAEPQPCLAIAPL